MSTSPQLDEDAWIARIERRFAIDRSRGIGIGDDAAVVPISPGARMVVSVDSQVEGTHFRRSWLTPYQLGRRGIEVALSDLAAMGARAIGVVLAIETPSLPDWVDDSYWDGVEAALEAPRGSQAAPQTAPLSLWGGNVCRTDGPLAIGITVFGELGPDETAFERSGARPGDELWISGRPGSSGQAREWLERNTTELSDETSPARTAAARSWQEPTARLDVAGELQSAAVVTAALDVSDGLDRDLRRLLSASKATATVDLDPLCQSEHSDSEHSESERFDSKPGPSVRQILYGGEDYELLFTVRPGSITETLRARLGVPLNRIGMIGGSGEEAAPATHRSQGDAKLREAGSNSKLEYRLQGRALCSSDTAWEHF